MFTRRGANREMRRQSLSEQMQDDLEPIVHSKPSEDYIKRRTSTIPFGYKLDTENPKYLKPIPDQLEALQIAEDLITGESVSLQDACDWIEYKTNRRISTPGLKKHIDKKYGKREERIARLGRESTSLLDRF